MAASTEELLVGIEAYDCLTPLGHASDTASALAPNRCALELSPVLGIDGGDRVPLALLGSMDETLPPRWLEPVRRLVSGIPEGGWGLARSPVIVTSSNFGVGSLHAFRRTDDVRHLVHGTPYASVELLRREFGWGPQVHVFSHACVTAHLGLAHAGRLLHAGLADRVLVFSFDFVSPFVAAGFHSLKILNGEMPAPYTAREHGAIGLGDGAAFVVLTRQTTSFQLAGHVMHNEMHHFTANRPDGSGFAECAEGMARLSAGRRVWIKGHGTGTLEAGRLEAEAFARYLPGAPLVGWKGALGHTLGSCGLVELAVAIAAWARGVIPGTVGGGDPAVADTVVRDAFDPRSFDGAVLSSNAFGGAHAAMLLTHD